MGQKTQNCKPYMVLWYLLSIHSLSNPNADILVTASSSSTAPMRYANLGVAIFSSSTGPRKRFREMIAAHGGGHGRSLPSLAPIRNSSELRGLCCRSCFGPRVCGRGITNSENVSEFSIRVSPSHSYNADRAGLGWVGGWP